ncbi:hypothetical protein K505DRAFT_358754 [Melanomma pulvis-pyrius CBS 109.77]|uniref:Uncharacterized protein n=1 Tax=Melanomma pulvis-pyrius CBS 109.77 TaxID=1314802 RepID=A0A6A6XME1_9PLEO|nr:hypothetical protein K505DRAFT_358754 [Melanomma pulvis-pyrius CBS 109.77]
MDPALIEPAVTSIKRYATRFQAGNKRTVSDYYGDEEEVEPFVPPSLQQKPTSTKAFMSSASRITTANSTSTSASASEADSPRPCPQPTKKRSASSSPREARILPRQAILTDRRRRRQASPGQDRNLEAR